MSYCRFTEGDVYAYECEGGVQFWTPEEGLNRLCSTFNDAYQYAMFLRDGHGLDVPSYAIEALKADAIKEAARICGPDSAIAELAAENSKLRELVANTWTYITEPVSKRNNLKERLARLDDLGDRMRELGIEVNKCMRRP